MRIIFIGTTKFSKKCFDAIKHSGQNIIACITAPPLIKINAKDPGRPNIQHFDFTKTCKKSKIPCWNFTPAKERSLTKKIQSLKPDLLFVAGWYHKVCSEWRKIPPMGTIGFHGSLLPKYRGGAPLVWAIINGEKRTGVSLFYLEEGMDQGDILAQADFAIKKTDTIAHILKKTEIASLKILRRILPQLENGTAPRMKQDESKATWVPQRKPEDGLIDWTWPREKIRNFIRAQTHPYPGAFTFIKGKKKFLWRYKGCHNL